MQKAEFILILNCVLRNNLHKSLFRCFSQTISKTTRYSSDKSIQHKYFLQGATSLNGMKKLLHSTLPNVACATDTCRQKNSVHNECADSDKEQNEEFKKVVDFLASRGCSKQVIEDKCLKHINCSQGVYFKLLLISDLHSDIVILMPLLSLSIILLRKASKQARYDNGNIRGFPNRIEYLSHHLEIKPIDLVPVLSKHPSILTMTFKRLELKMNILNNAGISPEYIVKDLWIFNYNEKLLDSRTSAAKKAKVELKPWMLRCSEKFFETMLIKCSRTREILNGDDEITYLAKRLECGKEYMELIFQKNSLLKTINVMKLEQIINFLYEKGYTAAEIRVFPRVFCTSLQTLRKRFEAFCKIKGTFPTMPQLCSSTKLFEKNIQAKKTLSVDE